MSRQDPPGEAAPRHEAVRGLEDPRDIHPSPEGLFNEPAGSPGAEPDPQAGRLPSDDAHATDDAGPGIVDPRVETIGPDI